MSWDSNIYYHPEKYGLTVVGEVDAGGGYKYDKFVIWKNEFGQHFWASDAGCSCPTPFDDTGLDTAHQGSLRDALNDLKVWAESDRQVASQHLIQKLESA